MSFRKLSAAFRVLRNGMTGNTRTTGGNAGPGGDSPSLDFSVNTNSMYVACIF